MPSCTIDNSVPQAAGVSDTVTGISPGRFGSSNRSVYLMRAFGVSST
jgi:hypothetical protein